MKLDANSPVPIFQQILDGICAAIAAGVYRPGELVPSVRQQALTLVVNPNTVHRAYEQLERDGLLLTRRGSGMEVAAAAPKRAAERMERAVRSAFCDGIRAGRAADLSRPQIDGLYRKAWDDERPSALRTAKGATT